jgi:Zn ribbon nucleic-acid-binding protein
MNTNQDTPPVPQAGAPCPKCGQSLGMIYRHIGGLGAQPHCLCASCGYQRRLMPLTHGQAARRVHAARR